ncbi:MAG: methyltransferase domain-containing protein, partial [Acidobacteriota bacterium]
LADGGWVRVRRQGTRHLYRVDLDGLDGSALRLWRLVHEQLASTAVVQQDAQRLDAALAARRERSRSFFDEGAAEWDALRDTLFGAQLDQQVLLGLLDPALVVGDLACGTGRLATRLAPCVGQIIAVDASAAMRDAARARLDAAGLLGDDAACTVDLRAGTLEQLPIADAALDVAFLTLALHHVAAPARALAEVHRVLRPGGRLLLLDMAPHDREDYRHTMGHAWLGFGADEVARLLAEAQLEPASPTHAYRLLPDDPDAQGPGLFASVARRPLDAHS